MNRTAHVLVFLAIGVAHSPAQADEPDPYARIIVDTAELRSGPGMGYQRVHLATRGDVFPLRSRATRGGYWFEVELPDGTGGWVLGDFVYVHEVGDEADAGRFLPWLFAPPPLPTATAELAVTAGVIGESFGFSGSVGGFMAIRPTVYISPTFGIEATAAASVSEGGRLFIGALGGIVNLFPESPVVPYLVVGGGFGISDPNADTFLLESGDVGVAYGGGGLRFGFRYRLTLRIEARAYAFYKSDLWVAQEELSAGLCAFF